MIIKIHSNIGHFMMFDNVTDISFPTEPHELSNSNEQFNEDGFNPNNQYLNIGTIGKGWEKIDFRQLKKDEINGFYETVMFRINEKMYYVLYDSALYIMNDNGKTIEVINVCSKHADEH